MISSARVNIMALLHAAMVTWASANTMIEPNVASTLSSHDIVTASALSMPTAAAVWVGAMPPSDGLAVRGWSDDSASVVVYCTTQVDYTGHLPLDHCLTVTHPLTFSTRTITHYPSLPTASEGRCSDTFDVRELTDEHSPLAADCIELAHRISGEGEWKVSSFLTGSWHQLVEWGTCAFGCRPPYIDSMVMIGNQDIIDILVDAVRDFERGGRVAAEGKMYCTTKTGPQKVWYNDWTIYHT